MRTDWRLQGLLYLAGLLAAAQFAKVAVSLGRLASQYPEALLPYAVSAISVAGVLFGVTAGVLVARLGPGRVLVSAMLAGGVLSLAQASMPAWPMFLVLRLLEGGAHLAIVVAAPTLMGATAAGPDKPVAMGLWGTFFGVGFALTSVSAGPITAPAILFLAHGILLIGLAGVLQRALPHIPPQSPEVRISLLARHIDIYTSARRVTPALGFFFHTVVFLGLLTFLPGVFGAPWLGPVLPLVALIGTFGAGVLARRIPARHLLYAGFALSIVGYVVALSVPQGWQVWTLLPLFVAIGIVPGASFASVPELNPDPADQARANGAVAQLGNIGTALSTPVMAAALAAGGVTAMALTTMALSATGLALTLVIHRNLAKTP
jgi:MFS family permease